MMIVLISPTFCVFICLTRFAKFACVRLTQIKTHVCKILITEYILITGKNLFQTETIIFGQSTVASDDSVAGCWSSPLPQVYFPSSIYCVLICTNYNNKMIEKSRYTFGDVCPHERRGAETEIRLVLFF